MPKQSGAQKQTMERVMHEYKSGELQSGRGGKVKNRQQAVAIGLSESGASKYASPSKNARNLKHTKAKEHHGMTGMTGMRRKKSA